MSRREATILAARARALAFSPVTDVFVTHRPGTSAADALLPAAVSNGGAPVGVAALPRQRSGLPATVAPVPVPLSTGAGAVVATAV
jgi:hypothetical protein